MLHHRHPAAPPQHPLASRFPYVMMLLLAGCATSLAWAHDDERQVGVIVGQRVDGYRGVWHGQESTGDEYSYKYSGGLATYTAKHRPLAIHAPQANKTFFVYGGTKTDGGTAKDRLLAMIGCYDHATGQLERPTLVHDKNTFDPHDNPSLGLDPDGHLWMFISGRGRGRAGWIYRSVEPYSIEQFELVDTGEYTYPQPWHVPGQGFFFFFTKYLGGRQLFYKTSPDGRTWSDDIQLAAFGGHYQVSTFADGRLLTAFNWHPRGVVNNRTNLYYVESRDFGRTWQNAAGEQLAMPLTSPENAALVHDYQADGKRIYLNDLALDVEGQPVVQYVVSDGWAPGPQNGKRIWATARFDGQQWERHNVCASDHNYDTGLIDLGADLWRILGPTETGPQAYHTGGEIALWESSDRGAGWRKVRQLTSDSPYNHTYVRPVVNAHDDFFAIWADGDPSQPSPSRIYFCDRAGERIWRLPAEMSGATARPEAYP